MTDTGPAPVSPEPTAEDTSRREELKAKITESVQNLKIEVGNRLDQFLDELGALI